MYLLTVPDLSRRQLLQAGLELLAEKGYKGATTRAIAERAGLTEVTLFRHFGSKEALLKEAIQRFAPPYEQMIPNYSGDLQADLSQLLQNYMQLVQNNGQLLFRLLPELMRHPELLEAGPPGGVAQLFNQVTLLFGQYQKEGSLQTHEPAAQMAVAFLGPVFAQFMLGGVWRVGIGLDVPSYVAGYLRGRSA